MLVEKIIFLQVTFEFKLSVFPAFCGGQLLLNTKSKYNYNYNYQYY